MTLKFEGNGLKFGRTWVDRIMGKVDKDQGVANAGKVLGIGSDGVVTPVEQTGGGGAFTPWTETIALADLNTYLNNNSIKVGDKITFPFTYISYRAGSNLYLENISTSTDPIYRVGGYPNLIKTSVTITKTIRNISDTSVEFEDDFHVFTSTNEYKIKLDDTTQTVGVYTSTNVKGFVFTRSTNRIDATCDMIIAISNRDTPKILGGVYSTNTLNYQANGNVVVTHMS